MIRFVDFEKMLQVGDLPKIDLLNLVMASGAGFVQYNTFLEWLCSDCLHTGVASGWDQKAKLEINKLKQENQQLLAQNHQLLDQSAKSRKISRSLTKATGDQNGNTTDAREQYDEAFASVGGETALDACYSDYIEIKALVNQKSELREPWEQDMIYQGLSPNILMRDAQLAVPHFEKACEEFRKCATEEGLHVSVIVAPIKGLVRSNTKVSVKYAGDLTQLSDICRATLSISAPKNGDGQDDNTLKRIYAFLKKIVKYPPPGVTFTHYHDRFQHAMGGGYRDILFIIRLRGVLCELQINVDAMLAVKEGAGHDQYEVERLHNDHMLAAAQMNDASALGQHLRKGARSNYTTGTGFSPLSYAALHDNSLMASYLLENGASTFVSDSTGQIPVARAVLHGKFDVAKVIIKAMKDAVGDPSEPLMTTKNARLSIITTWIILYHRSSADSIWEYTPEYKQKVSELFQMFDTVFERACGGLDSALADAIQANQALECRVLLQAKAQINRIIMKDYDRHGVLDFAAANGAIATVRTLLKAGALPLSLYSRGGKMYNDMKQRIIEHDMAAHMEAFIEASPDWLDLGEALGLALGGRNDEPKLNIARILLQRGAPAAHLNPTQLAIFVETLVFAQDEDTLRLLLKRRCGDLGSDPDGFKECGRAVREAAGAGLERIVRILAGAACPLEERDEEGSTAMHLAARGGHDGTMKILHKHGCIIDGPGEKEHTPACEAALNGQISTLQALMDDMGCDLSVGEGYDMKAKKCMYNSSWDRTLVHVAAMAGESETIQWLCHHGCDINSQAACIANNTPLHCAAQYGAHDAYKRLLELEANPNVLNDDNMTPLDVLKRWKEDCAQSHRLNASDQQSSGYPE